MDVPAGFEQFVRDESRALLRAAWLLTGDWAAAEDLVQSALAVAWTRWASLGSGAAPAAYVRRIVFTSFLRSRERRWVGEIAHADVPDFGNEADPYAGAETRHAMLAALRSLPPRQRAVIALRYLDDLSERDTAAVLGCSVGAIKSHSAKAIAQLRKTSLLNDLLGEGARE